MTCADQDYRCPAVASENCALNLPGTSIAANKVCNRTCQLCTGGINEQNLYPYESVFFFINLNLEIKAPLQCDPSDSAFICQNGGTCVNQLVNGFFGFSCSCSTEWTGDLCELRKR